MRDLPALSTYWPLYVGIILGCGILGFAVTRLARVLMFQPVRPLRVGPFRYQGTVPRAAEKLATQAADLTSGELLSGQELFSRLDPDRLADEARGPLQRTAETLAIELMQRYRPGLWELLPARGKQALLAEVRSGAPKLARQVASQVEVDVADVFDLRHLVHNALAADPRLLCSLVFSAGERVFAVLERRAAGIGLAIGVLATLLLAGTGRPVLLAVAGFLTGLSAHQLARRWVFGTRATWRTLRRPIASGYANTLATEIVTFDHIVAELLHGPRAARLLAIIRRDVQRGIDSQVSIAKPLVAAAIGSSNLREMKYAAAQRSLATLPETAKPAERYAVSTMDVYSTVLFRLLRMPAASLKQALRPAFEAREWLLASVGAVLGTLVGIAGWMSLVLV